MKIQERYLIRGEVTMEQERKYFLMCKNAKEIQKQWIPKFGDDVWDRYLFTAVSGTILHYHYIVKYCNYIKNEFVLFTSDDRNVITLPRGMNFIWLPRQDQLQEMIGIKYYISSLNFIKQELIEKSIPQYHDQFNSMEQLLLSLVMEKNYDKVWNGKDWIIKKEKNNESKAVLY